MGLARRPHARPLVVGVVVLLAWGRLRARRDEPLVDLRVTAQRPVLLTNLAAVAIGFGMMAQAIVVPQLLQLPTAPATAWARRSCRPACGWRPAG